MTTVPMALAQCCREMIDNPSFKKATVYIDEKMVVSLCRRFKFSKRNTRNDFVVKIGYPNYLERAKMKRYKKNKEKFPFGLTHLGPWPKKRK